MLLHLNNPSIVTFIDFDDHQFYIITEYLPKESLKDILDNKINKICNR